MFGSPLDRKFKTNGSICSKVVEKQLEGPLPTPVSSVGRSDVLSSKTDTQILKKNSSHALSTKSLCGKETESTCELKSAETRSRSSFFSPTISSSRKTNTEKQKVQVQQIKPRLKRDSESEAIKTNQVEVIPAPSRSPLPSSKPQLLHQKTQSKTPVIQPKIQKAPTSQLLQKRTLNHNSVSQFEPSKQYVGRSGTQKTSVPPQSLAGKTRIPTSIRQSKSSTSTKEPSRIRERYLGHEEHIHHIIWEGPDETFHSSGITCLLCESNLSYMPEGYANEYYDDFEPSLFPTVAILPCGHSFHAVCLDGITPEENSDDPPCFYCLSFMP